MREHENPDGELKREILIGVLTGDQMTDIINRALTGVIFLKHRGRSPGERRKDTSRKYYECERNKIYVPTIVVANNSAFIFLLILIRLINSSHSCIVTGSNAFLILTAEYVMQDDISERLVK